MRSKLVLAGLMMLSTCPVFAQVAPAAKISGLPLSVGVGLSDFDTDYYKPDIRYWDGRMIGISAWADYRIFHGLGVEVEGNTTFSPQPPTGVEPGQKLYSTSLKESTIQGGFIYKYRVIHKVRPFAKGLGGIGKIDFPSVNPLYTNETSALYSFGGGIEYKIWKNLNLRGEYDYTSWKGFRSGSQHLHPNGFTIGATYYLRGIHTHY